VNVVEPSDDRPVRPGGPSRDCFIAPRLANYARISRGSLSCDALDEPCCIKSACKHYSEGVNGVFERAPARRMQPALALLLPLQQLDISQRQLPRRGERRVGSDPAPQGVGHQPLTAGNIEEAASRRLTA
jgi:hypothetical protein